MNAAMPADTIQKIFTIRTDDFITLSLYDRDRAAEVKYDGEDYVRAQMDLDELLDCGSKSSFILEMQGDSMIDANIVHGCKLVVSRSIIPLNNQIVVAVIKGKFLVRRYITNSSGVRLMPANQKYAPLPLNETVSYQIWGVVTRIIIEAL